MAAPAKLLHVAALLAKSESAYGVGATMVASSDGVQMQFDQPNMAALFEYKYVTDGDLGPSMSSLGQIARVAPAARYAEGTIPALLRLPTSAYSASVLPGLHRLIQMCGFDATIVTSSGSESVTYTPTGYGNSYTSLALTAYTRQEIDVIVGVVSDLSIAARDAKPPKWSFAAKGLPTLPADSLTDNPNIPTGLAFPNSAIAPLPNVGITAVFGSYTSNAIVKGWDFALNRQLDPRINFNGAANAHAGFVPGHRAPEFKLQIEASTFVNSPYHTSAGFNPYALLDVGTALGECSIKLGSTQYNKCKIKLNQSQVIDVKRTGEGSTATFEVTVRGYCSSPTTNDDVSIICD